VRRLPAAVGPGRSSPAEWINQRPQRRPVPWNQTDCGPERGSFKLYAVPRQSFQLVGRVSIKSEYEGLCVQIRRAQSNSGSPAEAQGHGCDVQNADYSRLRMKTLDKACVIPEGKKC
jgi:hypothetical protein